MEQENKEDKMKGLEEMIHRHKLAFYVTLLKAYEGKLRELMGEDKFQEEYSHITTTTDRLYLIYEQPNYFMFRFSREQGLKYCGVVTSMYEGELQRLLDVNEYNRFVNNSATEAFKENIRDTCKELRETIHILKDEVLIQDALESLDALNALDLDNEDTLNKILKY